MISQFGVLFNFGPRPVVSANPTLFLYVSSNPGPNLVYLPFNNSASFSNINEGTVNYVMPFDATVESVTIWHFGPGNFGDTIVGTHINNNVVAVDTDTQALPAGATRLFTLGTDVDELQRLEISFDGQFNGGDIAGFVKVVPR